MRRTYVTAYGAGFVVSDRQTPMEKGGLTGSFFRAVVAVMYSLSFAIVTNFSGHPVGRFYVVDTGSNKVYVLDSTAPPSPDLAISIGSESPSSILTGESIDIQFTVRNRGTGTSAATTLRYYSSTGRTISAEDSEIGTDSVGALARQATSDATLTRLPQLSAKAGASH